MLCLLHGTEGSGNFDPSQVWLKYEETTHESAISPEKNDAPPTPAVQEKLLRKLRMSYRRNLITLGPFSMDPSDEMSEVATRVDRHHNLSIHQTRHVHLSSSRVSHRGAPKSSNMSHS